MMEEIDPKKMAGLKAVEYVQDKMIVGLGTGSTAYWAIQLIGEKIRQGLAIKAVCTSSATEKLAAAVNIPTVRFSAIEKIDIAIDGADEIDKEKNLLKGGGGALLREKIVAFNSKQFIVIADESKVVEQLGRFPLPVEVLSFGAEATLKHLSALCKRAAIRTVNGNTFITDNGNFIIDCHMEKINNPESMDSELKRIPGVLETGIFSNRKDCRVIIGYKNGDVKTF